jgi:hypothetical protein
MLALYLVDLLLQAHRLLCRPCGGIDGGLLSVPNVLRLGAGQRALLLAQLLADYRLLRAFLPYAENVCAAFGQFCDVSANFVPRSRYRVLILSFHLFPVF